LKSHAHTTSSGAFTGAEARQAKRLAVVLAITLAFSSLELTGAILARSDVLLADAVHLVLDVFALALSIVAMRLAVRPPTDRFTFGLRRVEPLAALLNGLLVLLAACAIVREGVLDFQSTTSPRPGLMLVVAAAALVVHGVSAWLIHDAIEHRVASPGGDGATELHSNEHGHAHGHHLSLRAVWLHLAGDALGAIVALVTATVIRFGGPPRADAAGSILVGLILAAGSIKLLRDATLVLLDAAPAHLPAHVIREVVGAEPGVVEVVDVRVWTLGAGHHAAAITVRAESLETDPVARIHDRLHGKMGIELVLVQVLREGDQDDRSR
jgi:cobalt-zinc-cadmium efflux system protein